MSPNDIAALIARSKCYLQLGEPEKALGDSETALAIDKNNIRAIYQKAEALYYLGKFEHSLMFFHRGLRIRPELANFRLGVQKTQEAIEATIGGCQQKIDQKALTSLQKRETPVPESRIPSRISVRRRNQEAFERKQARKLLGELFIDKEYLENLLKHPDLKRADTKTENVSGYAKDAIAFLNSRQEFWRQQKPTKILSSSKNLIDNISQFSLN
jgi:tetratricopeptide repeat protein 25